MLGRFFHRTALNMFCVTLLLGACACSTHHVQVTFDLPADYTLPDVGSIAVAHFTGAAGEDAADLLMHNLEQAGHYAMFRQAPQWDLPIADNFHVVTGFVGSPCSNFESDAVFYGATQAQAPQVSYTTAATHDALSGVGSDGRYQTISGNSEITPAYLVAADSEAQRDDEVPPAYTEMDESPFFDAPEQTPAPSQEDDLPPVYSMTDESAVPTPSPAPQTLNDDKGLPPPYSIIDKNAPAAPQPEPPVADLPPPYRARDNDRAPKPAPRPPVILVAPETRGASTSRRPRQSVETKICRDASQTVKVTLKVGLRTGARDHLTVVSQKRHHAPKACVVVPGRISLHQAPYYFGEVDHRGMHHIALVEAIDALSAKFVPRKVSEEMVLFSDKKIALSKQALAAATVGNWTLAASYYERAIEYAHSHNFNLKQRARVHYNYGIALAGQGEFAEALRNLDIAEFADSSDVYSEARVRVARYEALAHQARQQREQIAHLRQTASCTR